MSRTAQDESGPFCDLCGVQLSTNRATRNALVRGPRGLWQALASALTDPDVAEPEPELEETAHLAFLARAGVASQGSARADSSSTNVISLDEHRRLRRPA